MSPLRKGKGKGKPDRLTKPVRLTTSQVIGLKGLTFVKGNAPTRVPVVFMVALYPLTPVLSFLSTQLLLAFGTVAGVVAYSTAYRSAGGAQSRHQKAKGTAQVAQEWAIRVGMLPVAAVAWISFARWHGGALAVLDQWTLVVYLTGCLMLWLWLFHADVVTTRHTTKRAAAGWAEHAADVDMDGSQLVKSKPTKIGVEHLIDVRGTGKVVSDYLTGKMKERIAAVHGLPATRVVLKPHTGHAGFMWASIRTSDPWAKPIPHPRAADKYARLPRSVKGPIPVGADPEKDQTLTLTLFNEEGGQHIVIIAGTRGGKTTLMNSVVEHLTDSADCQVFMTDLSKGKDGRAWTPALAGSAMGPDAGDALLEILRNAKATIVRRAATSRVAVHRPTPADPAMVIILDEADQTLGRQDAIGKEARELVAFIMGKGASEAVILVIAAQRGVLAHIGTNDVKANSFVRVALGVSQPSELTWIIPNWEERGMPDMSTYGEGRKGVCLIVAANEDWSSGRSYDLHDLAVIERIAAGRPYRGQVAASLVMEPPADGVNDPDVAAWGDPASSASSASPASSAGRPDVMASFDRFAMTPAELAEAEPAATVATTASVADAIEAGLAAQLKATEALATPELRDRAKAARRWAMRRLATAKADQSVVVPAERVGDLLTVALTAGDEGFTRADAQRMTGLGPSQAAEYLRVMTNQGVLTRSGKAKAIRYQLNVPDTLAGYEE